MNRNRSNKVLTASCWTFFALAFLTLSAMADDRTSIDELLTRPPPPVGVVFEVAQSQLDALEWALPEIKKHAERLRTAFPEIKMAVVTHGKEEFALLSANSEKFSEVHRQVKSLSESGDIPVHVCGTHASWYEKHPEDFPAYVDVAPAGPAQINNYRELGYAVIRIRKPN